MKKKISLMVSVIMVLQILLLMLTVTWENAFTIKSMAAEATVNGIVWTYTLSNGEATEVKPKDKDSLPTEVTIPDTLDGYTVTSIGNDSFYLCTSLASITIPNSVTSIGNSAFNSCSSLTNITIPNSVTSIGNAVFNSCSSLTSINVEGNNQNYSEENGILFNKDKTEIICYPAGKAEIEYTIPSNVTSIRDDAFWSCKNLIDIEVEGNNQNYSSDENGIVFNKDKSTIVRFPEGKLVTLYSIPRTVTNIGNSAFYNCDNLESITIPDTVKVIGSNAFRSCNSLKSMKIPDSITSIGDIAFAFCYNLTSITIPDSSVRSIGNYAFYNCNNLTDIAIPSTLITIGKSAFSGCSNLTSITIKDSVTSIGDFAFSECSSLTSIDVEEDNQNYSSENGVLFNKDKTEIIKYPIGKIGIEYNIPNSVKKIGDFAFSGCSNLTNITIPNSVVSIEEWAFRNCSNLTSITIPNSVTGIGDGTFNGCNNLTSITIPDSVTSIGWSALSGCKSLIIYTYSGSKAEEYARYNHIPYILVSLDNIKISQSPTKTIYMEGENFSTTGMKVTATYKDESSREITDYTVIDGNNLRTGKTSVTISYTENGVTKTTTQPITVITKSLTAITVSQPPTKTNYVVGENFDTKGMKVTAVCNDGRFFEDVTNYITVTDGTSLKLNQQYVTISYTIGGVTKTTTQPITVTQASTQKSVTKITLSKVPTKTKYIQSKEELDITGGQIKVTYSDGTEETISITKGMVTGFDNTKVGKQILKISYGGKTTTYEVEIIADSNNNSGNNNTGDNNQNNNSGNNNTGGNSQNNNNSGNNNTGDNNQNNSSGNNNTGENNQNTNNSSSNNSQSGNSTNSGSVIKTGTSTESADKLPYTGNIVVMILIILLSGVTGISYIAYRRYRNI